MKIDKSSNSLPTTSVGEGASRASSGKSGGKAVSGGTASSTSVHLGATSSRIRSMESSMAGTPVVDVAKVAEIKQAITEGRFQIDSAIVADRLIASARELLGAGAR